MQAEVKDAYWALFDTEDLTATPGPALVELAGHRITEMAARYAPAYPAAMKCLLADLEPLHTAQEAHDLAAFRRAHPPGDLGEADDADGQRPGRSPGLDEPLPRGRVTAQVLDQHVAVDQDHASASRSR